MNAILTRQFRESVRIEKQRILCGLKEQRDRDYALFHSVVNSPDWRGHFKLDENGHVI